jgi:hypothetical protein
MTKLKRIKIIGDGTPRGTKVLDAETGEKLPHVQKVEFSLEMDGVGLVKVTTLCKLDEVDVEGWSSEDVRTVNGQP